MSIRKRIPWWLKIVIKILISFVPVGYQIWQNLGLFRHGHMDGAKYVDRIVSSHVRGSKILLAKKQKLTIVEIGPGDSVASALIFSSYNAQTFLIDTGEYSIKDINVYKKISKDLKEKYQKIKNIDTANSFPEMLDIIDSKYFTNGLRSFQELHDSSVDFIFSEAVLEHIHKDDFLPILRECRRILKPDGLASHSIDLKDHLEYGLNSLRFPQRMWNSKLFMRGGFYTNRIRYQSMLSLFQEAGFHVDVIKMNKWENLPIPRSSLHKEFSNLSDKDLLVSEFHVILKPKL